MRPYTTIRLENWPDVADICAEGRKTRCARTDGHAIQRPAKKAAARRRLRRLDRKAGIAEIQAQLEEQ